MFFDLLEGDGGAGGEKGVLGGGKKDLLWASGLLGLKSRSMCGGGRSFGRRVWNIYLRPYKGTGPLPTLRRLQAALKPPKPGAQM